MQRRPCKGCGKNRQEKFFVSPRGRICTTCQKKKRKRTARGRRLTKTYNITHEQYDAILEKQGGGCAICGRIPRYNLDVDHDHETNLVRGLLCKLCNRHLLPAARDDEFVLLSAASYLRQHELEPVLGGITASDGNL